MKFCMNCGSQLPENAGFCPSCGTAAGQVGNAAVSYNGAGQNQGYYNTYNAAPNNNTSSMSTKTTAIIAYITWIGFLVALLAGDKEGAKFHINQALVINLFTLASAIPVVGWFWGVFMFIVWIMGLVYACNGENKEVPLIGKIRILN